MKIKYVRPEYENNNQLEDIILLSKIIVDDETQSITGIVDIEELFG